MRPKFDFEFCPTLQALYEAQAVVGRSGKEFSLLRGLSTPNNILVLCRILLEARPMATLEIGMACGGSALAFASALRDLGQAPARQHIAIDAFQREGFDDVGRIQLERANLDGYVEVRESLSCFELPRLCDAGRRFGVIYVDGSHQFEDVFCDFYFCRLILERGGYLLFDDSSDAEVAKVIKFIQRNLGRHFEQISVTRYRHLGAVGKAKLAAAEKLHRAQLTIFQKLRDDQRPASPRMRSF